MIHYSKERLIRGTAKYPTLFLFKTHTKFIVVKLHWKKKVLRFVHILFLSFVIHAEYVNILQITIQFNHQCLCYGRFFTAIIKSHPQRNEVVRSDLEKFLPSIQDIQSAFVKVRQICVVGESQCNFQEITSPSIQPLCEKYLAACSLEMELISRQAAYGFLVVQAFDCCDCLQILLRSLRKGGFHLLKTPVGWSMSGKQCDPITTNVMVVYKIQIKMPCWPLQFLHYPHHPICNPPSVHTTFVLLFSKSAVLTKDTF